MLTATIINTILFREEKRNPKGNYRLIKLSHVKKRTASLKLKISSLLHVNLYTWQNTRSECLELLHKRPQSILFSNYWFNVLFFKCVFYSNQQRLINRSYANIKLWNSGDVSCLSVEVYLYSECPHFKGSFHTSKQPYEKAKLFEKRVRAQSNHKMTWRALKYLRSFKLVRPVFDMLHKVSRGQKITICLFLLFLS